MEHLLKISKLQEGFVHSLPPSLDGIQIAKTADIFGTYTLIEK